MAQEINKNQPQFTKVSFGQRLYAAAEAVPVFVGKGVNAALKLMLGGSRSERLIKSLLPVVQRIGEIGETLEEDLQRDFRAHPVNKLLEHLPGKLHLVLTEELLRDSPEEVRDRRCGEVEKTLVKAIGQGKALQLVPGLSLDIQAQWHLLLDDALRAKLCEDMRSRLAGELLIALGDQLKTEISRDAGQKFPSEIAEDMAAAVISRLEKALRGPVSELFFKPLTQSYKDRLAKGEALDDLLPEAFAACRLASQLVIKTPGSNPKSMRHFDVQLIGGIVLHQGKIAEMVTGEGKTLVATLPAYLNALTGKGVHVITTNDYLAKRDAAWMGPLYEFLGLTVGIIRRDTEYREKQKAYRADITHGTNDEFGFDYLRDNMKTSAAMQVQRPLHYAIVDEVDNILVDEARTPLIISGMPEETTDKYYRANAVAQRLRPSLSDGDGGDYKVSEKEHTVTLTEQGIVHAQEQLGVDSFYSGENVDWPHHMNQALSAKELYRRDRDYVVKNGEVLIVDEFTGRLMPGRRWSDGLHQAVEAKERLHIKQETQTLATITYQNFFRMYEKLSGMTGTALTEAEEFNSIYTLDVVPIPTNKPLRRVTFPDVIYATGKEKYEALVDEIAAVHAAGRPVLVGTIAIETSELISRLLEKRGIKHEVLNAKFHEREAAIIALAGQPGGVTIATNMAGRGTDIVLGTGVVKCRKCIIRSGANADSADQPLDACRHVTDDPNKTVSGIENLPCGLHIVGTERHEARRIDNQLRGRAGRQGDPGSSRFFLSLEDDLMRIFMGPWVRGFMARAGFGEGQQIESAMVSRAIERAQRKVEQYNFEIRKSLLEYDEVMDQQRNVVYSMRQKVLNAMIAVDVRQAVEQLAAHFISEKLRKAPEGELVNRRNFEPLQRKIEAFGVNLSAEQWFSAGEKAFADIIRNGTEPQRVKLGNDYLRRWIETSLHDWISADLHPSTWQLDPIREWAARRGVELSVDELVRQADKALTDFIVAQALQAANEKGLEAYLGDWVAAGLITDLPLIAGGNAWDYSHVRHWAEAFGVSIPVAEWDPISRKRDKQEELILHKAMEAFRGMPLDAVVAKLTLPVLGLYLQSPLYRSNARPDRIALWARRRLDAALDTTQIQALFADLKNSAVERALQAMTEKFDAEKRTAGELALIEVESYLRDDLSSDDRNLIGLAAAFEERYGVRLSPFEMTKMSYAELISFLVGRVPAEVKYEIDAETVELMVLEMINNSIARAIEQFVDDKAESNAVFTAVRDWLEPFGYRVDQRDWQGLTLAEFRQALGVQARRAHENESREEVVERFVRAAVSTFLNSPLFAGERGYASLAGWAQNQFFFNICTTIEADVRKIADKRKADLRTRLIEEKTAVYSAATDDPAVAARELIGETIDAFISVASNTEDFDETRVADWAAKAFKLSLSRTELESRLESGDQAVKDYILETAAANYAKRSIEKVADDVVDAILSFCTSGSFIENWNYETIDSWISNARLPIRFDIGSFQEQTREEIIDYFAKIANDGYKDRAKEEVVPAVVANAASVVIECELSAPGRNYNSLALRMNQKFNLGISPFQLSKKSKPELKTFLHEVAGHAFALRKRQLGKYGFLRSISVLVLHTLDTRWKDHLYSMDHLKSGIGLRGYAGIDPKDAYKKEGYEMFTKMLSTAEESISDLAMRVSFDDEESSRVASRQSAEERYVHEEAASFNKGRDAAAASADKGEAKPAPIRVQKMPGRNDPCPCGKKKPDGTPVKYKNCCMRK